MDCGICSTSFRSRGEATCASCARALVYQARLNHLTDLLSRESLHERVGNVTTPPSQTDTASLPRGPEFVDITESAAKHSHVRVLGETEALETRYTSINQQLQLLNQQIEHARSESVAREADHKRRRAQLAAEKQQLEHRMPQLLDPLKTNMDYLRAKLDRVHSKTRDGRVKLCHETARLAGLQQRRRKMPDGQVVEDYIIGRVPIPDLRHLNSERALSHLPADNQTNVEPDARPDHVTAALANICRLLTTTCHYLSVRLPAEITPAHVNYPHPTIFSTQSSYQGFELPFPGSSNSSTHSPSASRLLEHRALPKLRLLHLDKPLVRLAKEDAVSYNRFVEGVTLLAWDVAWLCRTQGLPVADSWDSLCDLGKNLHLLFREHAVAEHRTNPPATQDQPVALPSFGQMSHAANLTNIESPRGIDLMRSWKLGSPHSIIDKLKSHLVTEMAGADWDIIDDDEVDGEREDEQAVLVGGRRATDRDTDQEMDTAYKGGSGWTKVKAR